MGTNADPQVLDREMRSEVATLRYVREHTSLPVPIVKAYSTSGENPIGFPYVIMTAVLGGFISDLVGNIFRPTPDTEAQIQRYLDCQADFQLQLSTLRFGKIGSLYFDPADDTKYIVGPLASTGCGPFSTALEYYESQAEEMERAALSYEDDDPEQRKNRALTVYLYRLAMGAILPTLDPEPPFLLGHNDMHEGNALVDEVRPVVQVERDYIEENFLRREPSWALLTGTQLPWCPYQPSFIRCSALLSPKPSAMSRLFEFAS